MGLGPRASVTSISDLSFREWFLTYDYYEGIVHAIQVLGRSDSDDERKITCLGNRDSPLRKIWRQGRVGTGFVNHGGPSPWEFDFEAVRARLEEWQGCDAKQRATQWVGYTCGLL